MTTESVLLRPSVAIEEFDWKFEEAEFVTDKTYFKPVTQKDYARSIGC